MERDHSILSILYVSCLCRVSAGVCGLGIEPSIERELILYVSCLCQGSAKGPWSPSLLFSLSLSPVYVLSASHL